MKLLQDLNLEFRESVYIVQTVYIVQRISIK